MIHITTERAASTGERGSLENQSPNEFISGANEVLLSAVYEGDQNKTHSKVETPSTWITLKVPSFMALREALKAAKWGGKWRNFTSYVNCHIVYSVAFSCYRVVYLQTGSLFEA